MNKATPRPWTRDEYGHVRGSDGQAIVLTGFCLATGYVPRESQPFYDDDLVFAAVNAYDAHRELARIVRIVLESSVRGLPDDHRAYLAAVLKAVEASEEVSR